MTNKRIVREIDPASLPQQPANTSTGEAVRSAMKSVVDAPSIPLPDRGAELPLKSEVVESCEVTLLDGSVVVMARPKYPAIMVVARAFKNEQDNLTIMTVAKILCYIRTIDGQPVGPLSNEIDFRNLMARLGDDGLDVVSGAFAECWPPVGMNSLPALKKNLRGP